MSDPLDAVVISLTLECHFRLDAVQTVLTAEFLVCSHFEECALLSTQQCLPVTALHMCVCTGADVKEALTQQVEKQVGSAPDISPVKDGKWK